jgi:excisionase family DNA binding protein
VNSGGPIHARFSFAIISPYVTRGQLVRVRNLQEHPEPYVTVAELAAYWLVGRKQIYKQIDAGTLPAIRLGPRLMRIRTVDAIEFEGRANLRRPPERAKAAKHSVKSSAAVGRRRAGHK